MSGSASKRKGANAELEVASLLQKWWHKVEPTAVFKRTPGSGGWAHGLQFKSKGDIIVTTETGYSRFPFFVEVKRFESFSLKNFLKGGKSPIRKHWEKAKQQAAVEGKWPMLFVRRSREPWIVIVPWFLKQRLSMPNQLLFYGEDPTDLWDHYAVGVVGAVYDAVTLFNTDPIELIKRDHEVCTEDPSAWKDLTGNILNPSNGGIDWVEVFRWAYFDGSMVVLHGEQPRFMEEFPILKELPDMTLTEVGGVPFLKVKELSTKNVELLKRLLT